MTNESGEQKNQQLPNNADESLDMATQSLAEALRVSFKLLGVIMVVVVIAFLLTGVKAIESQEKGIIKVFGKHVRTATQGLVYTWPFPVGDIEIVTIKEQRLTIDDFWMFETPQDKTKPYLERRVMGEGLRPGWDGALLTGDRNLLHVKLECTYVVNNPVAFKSNISNLEETLRDAICGAAIRAAARRTADAIQRTQQMQFLSEVMEEAQIQLDNLTMATEVDSPGIVIRNVLMTEKVWPLRALPAFNSAQTARSKAEGKVNSAMADAEKILNAAAGPITYKALVGDPARIAGIGTQSETQADQYDLIGQYSRARDKDDEKLAQQLLDEINVLLVSNKTSGEASKVIASAKAYRTSTIQKVRSRAQKFKEMLPEFQKAPEFMMERLWAETREAILSSPTVEKYYVTPSKQVFRVQMGRDPEIAKEVEREFYKAAKENENK